MRSGVRVHVGDRLDLGAEIVMNEREAHYLRDVRRLRAGDKVAVFNGTDGEWDATIVNSTRRGATLRVGVQLRSQATEPDLWLVFAPIKRARIDQLVEKATELGVSVLQPVHTRHTVVERLNLGRLRTIATEASEQCERLTVPRVRPPIAVSQLLNDWPQERRLLLCVETGPARPIGELLLEGRTESSTWAVMVGPEGGFALPELDLFLKLPFVTPVGLGPRILRAETAALAALACWQVILGDGSLRPSPSHA
jgi:16S rRNA (uracil1498-N3)-methyltransferase